MRRRIDIRIDRIVVDQGTGLDRRSIAAAVERELVAQLGAPGAAAALTHRNAAVVEGGTIGHGDAATALGRRVGAIVTGRGER